MIDGNLDKNNNSDNNPTDSSGGEVNLVSGATGLVGSHLISQLIKLGKKVRAIYRSTVPEFEGSAQVEWVKGDILDVATLELAMSGVTTIFHCAAMVLFDPTQKDKLFRTNIQGTANVVNTALLSGVQKLVYVSSIAALGKNSKVAAIDESMHWTEEHGGSIYGKSKYFAELEVWRGFAEGLPCVIVNPSIILGAGDWNSGSSKLFKTAYKEFAFYTDGMTGFVDVEDVVAAMIQLNESNIIGERFILNAENRFYRDIFSLIAKSFGKKPPTIRVNRFLAEVVRVAGSLQSIFTKSQPLLTKETVDAAQSQVKYDNNKLLEFLPGFSYRPIEQTVARVCLQLKKKYHL